MATRKRNEYLDIESSDGEESDRGYDSEAAEESKGRAAKRRKVHAVDDDVDVTDSENGDDRDNTEVKSDQEEEKGRRPENGDHRSSDSEQQQSSPSTKSKEKPIKPLDKKKLEKTKKKKNKTGVIYLSSLPPYLKPSALKTMLLQRGFGPINRVFLTPAVPSTGGGSKRSNRRKMYTDGWVEFESKKTAKICAETLNANIVGGRKGGWYHDDVWNMKYLKGFKWDDLMEQMQRERSEREARRRIEDARARKEDKVFLAGVEKGKVVEGIRKKRQEKKAKSGDSGAENDDTADLEIRRVFKQNEVRTKGDKGPDTLGDDAKRVLGKIF